MKFSTRKSVSVSSRALVLVWVLVTAVKGQASSQASPPAESGRSSTPPPVVLVHDLDHRPSYTNNPQSPEIREQTLRPLNKRVPYLYTAGASQISHVRSQRNVKSIFPSSGSTRLEQPPYNTVEADVGGRHQSEANYYQFSKQHEPAVQRKTLITENENRYKGPQKLSQDRITYSSLAELLRIPVVTLPPSQSVIGSTRAHVPKERRQMLPPTGIKLTPPLRLLLNNEPSSPLPPSTSRKSSTASPLISEDDGVVHHTNESTKRNKREFMKKVNLLHKYFEIEKLESNNDFRISENGQNNRRNTREIIDDYLESQHGRRRPENTFSNADTTVGLWAVLGSGTSTPSTRDDTHYSTPAMDRGDPIITSAERSITNNANPPNPIQTDRSSEREMTENGPSLTVNTDHSTRTGSVHHSLTTTHINSHTSTITDEDDQLRKTEDRDKSLNIILDKDAYLQVTDERDHLSKTSGLDDLLDTRKDRADKLGPTQYEDDTLSATHYEDNTHSSTHYKDDFGTSHYEDDIRGPTHYEYNFSGEVIDEDDYSGATTERDVFGTTTDRNDLPDTASGDGDYPRTTTDESGLPGTHTDGDNYTGITADEHFERGRYPSGQDESDVLGMKRNEHEHTIKVEDGDRVEKLCKKIKVLFDFLDTNHTSLDFSDKNFDISKLEYEKHVIMLRKEFERLGLYEEEYKNGDLFLSEKGMSKQNEYPLASKVSDYKDWPESGDLQIPAAPSATPPASPDVELWLKDKDGRAVEGKLLPALQYSVSVVAPQSTMLLLSAEGPGGVGVGRLLPDPPHPAHVCHSPPALVSGTAPLVARWRLHPGHLPDHVIFRVRFLSQETAGQRALIRHLHTDTSAESVVGVEVESVGAEEASRACGWGWVGQDGRCFLLVEEKARWEAAEAACVGRGGHLAAVTSPQVAALLSHMTANSASFSASSAYWVGASDALYENSFTWTSGAPFSYSEWFPGWSDQAGYNTQPSDDGLSNEDCVELRRAFRLATKGSRSTHALYWNDRSCLAANYYICEKPAPGGEPERERWSCNRSLALYPHSPPTVVTSPGFPAHYPPSRTCVTTLTAPPAAHLVVQFDAFVLEPHPTCEYDWVSVEEAGGSIPGERRCGDWSAKLKLLRHVSSGNTLVLTFTSDYAHEFPGFRARVSARTGSGCGDGREVRHGDMCYLLVPYPQVTWNTATHICADMEGSLASVASRGVLTWLAGGLRALPDYAAGTLYWLGATLHPFTHTWTWHDGSPLNVSEVGPVEGRLATGGLESECLSLQELSPAPPLLLRLRQHRQPPFSLSAHQCDLFGGYICSRRVPDPPAIQSSTVLGYGGNLTTPGYPSPYPNNLHLMLTLRGPPNSRIVISFFKLDLEYQLQCLYDYVGLQTSARDTMVRYCGRHTTDMNRFDFESETNEAVVTFHSDWSVVGSGVHGWWRVVDTSACPLHHLTQPEGVITSPNFPEFYLGHLHCTTRITAPEGQRVWLQFKVFEVGGESSSFSKSSSSSSSSRNSSRSRHRTTPRSEDYHVYQASVDASAITFTDTTTPVSASSTPNQQATNHRCQENYVEVILGSDESESVRLCGSVSSGEVERLSYVSYGSSLTLILHTSRRGRGKGFQASYSMGTRFQQQAVVHVESSSKNKVVGVGDEGIVVGVGRIHALNFPLAPAPGVTLVQQLLAPPGHQLHLRLHHVAALASPSRPCLQDFVEVEDWYAGRSGTVWKICKIDRSSHNEISIRSTFNTLLIREVHLGPRTSSVVPESATTITTTQTTSLKNNASHTSSTPSPFGVILVASQRLLSDFVSNSLGSLSSVSSEETKRPAQSAKTLSVPPGTSQSHTTQHSTISHNAVFYDFNSDNETSSPVPLGSPPIPTPSPSSPEHIIASPMYLSSSSPGHMLSSPSSSKYMLSSRTSSLRHIITSPTYPSPPVQSRSPSSTFTASASKTSWVSSVAFFSATYEVRADPGWLNRSMGVGVGSVGVRVSGVASCDPSPCLNGGRCITEGTNHSCLCTNGYTGAFCQVRWCEMSPCLWGQCHSGGPNGYICVCERGYGGLRCQDRVSPCDGDPCQSRGACTPGNHTFKCQCHAWWEGERCEHRMLRIPFKPLSERMFEEPFWLGLMTVAIVMGCIGIIFCIKKHFAEKIEKFFAEEIERSKYEGAGGSAAASSSSSPRRSTHKCRSQTASPRADSKKILRHLVTPPVGHRAASFDEFLHLRTQTPKCSVERTRSADIATELLRSDAGDGCVPEGLIRETSLISLVPSPSKHDKKVTFAKLLDKMSKEMSSSSSDMSCPEEKSPSRIFSFGGARRSPRRSPRIRHTQRYSGSGSEEVMETPDVSSSEMTPDPPKRLLTVKSSSSPSSKTSSPQSRTKMVKISSADSLLAMIKNFGGSGRPSSNPSSPHGSEFDDSSSHPSPSTTPTTPQKALPQKQDTLTVPGALQVQVQSAGGSTQHSGPVITLEVPTNDQHRCLSPITELPTPVPTPVPSPLPTPCRYRPKPRTSSESNDNKDSEDTESEFSLSISVERSSSDSSGPDHRIFFTSLKSLHSLPYASIRSETLSPTGATVTPSSSLSSRTPSPVTSPNISPASSPKVKIKPPPLHIPNANLLKFCPEKGESSSGGGGAYGGISVTVPVIKVEDTDEVRWDSAPRTRSQSVDVGRILQAPLITVSSADDDPQSPSPPPQPLIIPTLNVTLASPPALRKQYPPVPTINIEAPQPSKPPVPPPRRHPLQREKAGSLDLHPAPAITVTSILSEAESDTDSPTNGCRRGGPSSCYLSPFLGVDLRASESNLSSSGYSSAYSPGPSRCSSNNPLCPEEPSTPSVSSIPPRALQIPSPPPAVTPPNRSKRRPLLKSPPTEIVPITITPSPLLRTDSETTDDPAVSQPEADSALELDTNDECSDSVMQGNEVQKIGCVDEAEAQRQRLLLSSSHSFPKESPRLARSPPAIVVHTSLHSESSLEDCLTEKPARLSPVSSRSESPISDSRLSVVRIYPAFFGVSGKPELPYTDSDGLYDCPSSEVLHSDSHASTSPLKRLGRKRLKRSPGKGLKSLLGIGSVASTEGVGGSGVAGQNEAVKSRLEPPHWDRSPRRHSPKRRIRAQTSVDLLSSSNESITSQSPVGSSSSPGENVEPGLHEGEHGRDGNSAGGRGGRRRRPLLRGESIPTKYLTRQGSVDASGEETQEEQLMLKPTRGMEELPRHRKLSRFRNFGNQIRAAEVWVSHCRFLRRLQLSRGAKDHLVSPAGSSDSDPECGPPAGPSCVGPSNKITSNKGGRSPSSQVKYTPVSTGCIAQSSP